MAWAFVDNWRNANAMWYGDRMFRIQRNAAGSDYDRTAAFDYFDDAALVDDYLYFGCPYKWWGLKLEVGTAFAATSVTFAWEYYDGSAWQTLNVENGDAMLNTGTQIVSWTPPHDWGSLGAHWGYGLRCRIAALTTITEGGANATNLVEWNFASLQVTGTVSGLSSAKTADLAGSYTLLSATTPAASLAPLEMPTHEIGETSDVDVTLAGCTLGAGDTVVLTGIDHDGNALTETIDVSGGNGTYTSTNVYRNLTDVACNGFADGTIAVTQNRWGLIANYAFAGGSRMQTYLLKTHLMIGDGSSATEFTLNNHVVHFVYGTLWYCDLATFLMGQSAGAGDYAYSQDGSIIVEGHNYYVSMVAYWPRIWGQSTLTWYGCTYRYHATGYTTENVMIFYESSSTIAWTDCVFEGDGTNAVAYIKALDSLTMTRCRSTGSWGWRFGEPNTTLTDYLSTAAIRAELSSSTEHITLDNPAGPSMYTTMYSAAYALLIDGTIDYGDCTTNSWSHTIDGIYRLVKRFDLTVIDENGDPLESVDVIIVNNEGETEYTGSTNALGQIPQQQLKYAYMDHVYRGANTWTIYTPHTVTLDGSGIGYETRSIEYTMDQRRDEVEMLGPESASGGRRPRIRYHGV